MRIRYVSDLHLDTYDHYLIGKESTVASRIAELTPAPEDEALIVAGDLISLSGEEDDFARYMRQICNLWAGRLVYFVGGNHESWGSSLAETWYSSIRLRQEIPNLRFMDCDMHQLRGAKEKDGPETRLLGLSLWYQTERRDFPDFSFISDLDATLGSLNRRERMFLEGELREGDIVVSHFLPSWQCVRPKWAGSKFNDFFVSDYEALILERKPAIWIHGHTHDAGELTIGSTRVLCNPLGRPSEITGYDPARYIEV